MRSVLCILLSVNGHSHSLDKLEACLGINFGGFGSLARTWQLIRQMQIVVKKPSIHTIKNLTLWLGILTALVLIMVTFLEESSLSATASFQNWQPDNTIEKLHTISSIVINSIKQFYL